MKRLWLLLALAFGLATARAQIYVDDADVWLSRTRARFEVEDLQNYGTNRTGAIRIVLYATEKEWNDTSHRKVLASFGVTRLQPGQVRHHLHKTVHLNRPHWGWYWLTIAVQEHIRDENGKYRWTTRDFIELDEYYFPPTAREIFWPF